MDELVAQFGVITINAVKWIVVGTVACKIIGELGEILREIIRR